MSLEYRPNNAVQKVSGLMWSQEKNSQLMSEMSERAHVVVKIVFKIFFIQINNIDINRTIMGWLNTSVAELV